MAPVRPVPPLLEANDPPHPASPSPQSTARGVPLRTQETGTIAARFVVPALRWALVLEFVGAAAMKLSGQPATVALFAAVGLGQWFRYAVGSFELVGAMLLASSRTTLIGAVALSALMVGAARTEIMILDRLPVSSGATLGALVALGVLAWRWGDGRGSGVDLAEHEVVNERARQAMARDGDVEP
jgi:putative oxidoreductase